MNRAHMLKKIPLLPHIMGLPHYRMLRLLFPIMPLLGLMTTCQEPPPHKPEPYANTVLSMAALQVNSIDAQLKISLMNLDSLTGDTLPIILNRDGHSVQTLAFIPPDTTLWDEGLEPNQTYTYTAYRQSVHNSSLVDSSNTISLTTMDTTSHSFTWEIDTLGGYLSWINDIAIVNPDDIWAVGYITTENEDTYNAAHWDGQEWELRGIFNSNIQMKSIFYFSENDIWVTSQCYPYHWNGIEWTQYRLHDYGFPVCVGLDIWGTSSNNMYFVGEEGAVIHYDGTDFSQIDCGVDTRFTAVSGTPDGEYVFIAGDNFLLPLRTSAVMLHDGVVQVLYDSDNYDTDEGPEDWGPISAVGVFGDIAYWVTYQGLWKYNFRDRTTRVDRSFQQYGWYPMTVSAPNDIFLAGGAFKYAHFNGASWYFGNELYNEYNFSHYCGRMTDNLAVLGGYAKDGSGAIIARGAR